MLYTSILACHKESFASMILRNEWYVVPSGYSSNTHMFVFGRHPLVSMAHLTNTCMSLMRTMRHFISFGVSFKTISDHSDWNFRSCFKHNFHKHFEWFSNCFCQCSSIVLNCIKKNKHFYGTLVSWSKTLNLNYTV